MKPQKSPAILTVDMLLSLNATEFDRLTAPLFTLTSGVINNTVAQFENQIMPQIKRGGQKEKTDFYENVLAIMKAGQKAEMEIKFWRETALKAKVDAQISRETASVYWEKLMTYEAIEKAINDNTLDTIREHFKNQQPTWILIYQN